MIIFDDSDRKADERMEQVFEAIKNKDQDALKAMSVFFGKRSMNGIVVSLKNNNPSPEPHTRVDAVICRADEPKAHGYPPG